MTVYAGTPVAKDNLLMDVDYDALAARIRDREITAIFCCNDKLAVKMISNLRSRNLRIPQDVSIMGFDDWQASPDVIRELTTIRQDFTEIGANTAYLLFSLLQGKFPNNPVKILSDVSLVVRRSVSPPQIAL